MTRVCAECGKPVVPCHHTPSRALIGWDHAASTAGSPCAGLLSAISTVVLDAATAEKVAAIVTAVTS